jgi:polyphenol oxidase
MPMMFMTTRAQPSGGFEWTQAAWGPVLRCRPLLEVVDHFFTTASLGLAKDSAEWDLVAELAGVPRARLRLLSQVHGHAIAVASTARQSEWTTPEADGAISDDPAVALGVRVADCAPVLMADRRQGVVAAVHAGWRSTMQCIAGEAVGALQREFGTDPADIIAAIGPSLGACCGEMGEEVVDAFRDAGHAGERIDRWFSREHGRRPHFDLWRANADQLHDAGVPVDAIHVSGLCTRTHHDLFHSFRASGREAGRMVGVIRARG